MRLDLDLLATPFYIIKRLQRKLIIKYGSKLDGKVLDAGCGDSPYKKYLSADQYIGMDDNPASEPDVVGSVLDIPLSAGTFDNVLCTEFLSMLNIPQKRLASLIVFCNLAAVCILQYR